MAAFVAQHQVGILGFAEIVGHGVTRFVLPGGRFPKSLLFSDNYIGDVIVYSKGNIALPYSNAIELVFTRPFASRSTKLQCYGCAH